MSQITVSYSKLEEMYQALRQIGNIPNIEMTMRIARNIKKFEKPYRDYTKKVGDIQREHCAKKPNGDALIDERTGAIVYTNHMEADKAFVELAEEEITFEVVPIEANFYAKEMWYKISANLLAPLLDTVVIEGGSLKLTK